MDQVSNFTLNEKIRGKCTMRFERRNLRKKSVISIKFIL